jgi:TonB family protein
VFIEADMLTAVYRGILVVLLLSLLPLSLQAQDNVDHPLSASSSNPDAIPANISKDILVSHGFSFDDQKRPMCKVAGPEGDCRVEAFVFSETNNDQSGYTCRKLDRATYVGHCVHGKLDGLSVVIADGSTKITREAFISYFLEGRIAYPAMTSYLRGDTNFGVRDQRSSNGCVYFGKWDRSAEQCKGFTEIYGKDIFTESNAQKLRDGTFDLGHYSANFVEFMQQKGGENKSFLDLSPQVTLGKLIHQVPPVYPPAARAQHIDGSVKLRVLIDKQGKVTELAPISGPKELIPAALEAVRQWKFEPTLVNGKPADFHTEITVNFKSQ